jgi:hypothetical protein
VKKVEVKIVGLISDEDELDQIQSIAKIFVYEQRMKCFQYPIKNKTLMKKNNFNYKKNSTFKKNGYNKIIRFTVRGLI